MPTTKNAILRFQVLDRCFRNPGKKYFWEDLLNACNESLYHHNGEHSSIKKRQLMKDIVFMESEAGWNIPLIKYRENRRVYYRYDDLSFSINNQPLNENEISQLQSALLILNKFQGLPQFEWMEELLPRLQKGIEPKQISPIFHFDHNPFLKGKELIGNLFNHILYRKVLKIEYQDYQSDSPYTLVLHPHLLKEYNNRWFLFGYNPEKNKQAWNLALDRILSLQVLDSEDFIPCPINWTDYFYDIMGVTKKDGVTIVNIELWFYPLTAPYIKSKPIHGSQKIIRDDEEGLIIKIQVIPNYELYQQLSFYGSNVKILSPEAIKKAFISNLEKTLKLYQSS